MLLWEKHKKNMQDRFNDSFLHILRCFPWWTFSSTQNRSVSHSVCNVKRFLFPKRTSHAKLFDPFKRASQEEHVKIWRKLILKFPCHHVAYLFIHDYYAKSLLWLLYTTGYERRIYSFICVYLICSFPHIFNKECMF